MPEEQFTNTNIQTAFPVSSQDKPQCTEGALDLTSSKVISRKLAAKSLRHDDSIIIKLGIESGESVSRSDNVRKLLFFFLNTNTFSAAIYYYT